MSPNYLWVVLSHKLSASSRDDAWDDGHTVKTVSIHNSLSAANRVVMERTRDAVSNTFDYEFPEDDDEEVEDQDQGDLGQVSFGKHGGLYVVTSEDRNRAEKVWVERQVLHADPAPKKEKKTVKAKEDVAVVGTKRKNESSTKVRRVKKTKTQ